MFRLNFRIGTKLAISSGVSIVLLAGVTANQMIGNAAVSRSSATATTQQDIVANAIDAKASMRGMMVGVRDLRLAQSPDDARKAVDYVHARLKSAAEFTAKLVNEIRSAESREKLDKIKKQLADVSKAFGELAAARTDTFAHLQKRTDLTGHWAKLFADLAGSPAIVGKDDRQGLGSTLSQADAEFKDARSASWRYSATGEKDQSELAGKHLDKAASLLKEARKLAGEKTVIAGIDELAGIVPELNATIGEIMQLQEKAATIVRERTLPTFAAMAETIDQVVEAAKHSAKDAVESAAEEMTWVERVALAGSLLVIIVLIASAVYAFVGIARPLSRLNRAMGEMAGGNLNVTIPGMERADEVGDIAKTIGVIRGNAEREAVKKQEETQHAEAERAAQRKADMQKLADEFEAAVGEIVQTVSSASTELEASATTLTKTAETTQQLSTTVAAASEEASANVQSVASATEEMGASVGEIGRQVQESSRISNEAVDQARKTDDRINKLSQAANRIGDVTKLITTIAEQTNLLALNATIEAARAGAAGKGFAVVAQEVKALAAQTAKATSEISGQIAEMQSATQDSVAAIKEIGGTIGRISEIATTIASAVEEQVAATQEITRNVQQAAAGTTQVASNITDVNRGAAETGSASAQVLSSAQSLANESNRLKLEMGKFLESVRAA